MKSANIVKKLQKEGYNIIYKKWGYWDSIPHVQLEGFDFALAECVLIGGAYGLNMNFIYNHVLEALDLAKNTNYILLQLIKANSEESYEYEPYLIQSMQDYYRYLKKRFPWDYWSHDKKRLEREYKKIILK